MKTTKYLLYFLVIIITACQSNENNTTKIIKEVYQTDRNESDDVDSPAFWQGKNGENWLISTAKASHLLIVDDASTGKNIMRFGSQGNKIGEFQRPNGISVVDDYLFVVERDNRRVQVLSLPALKPIGTFGDFLLQKPYGIFISKNENSYSVFVTDNYEFEKDIVPEDSLLDKRVLHFTVIINDFNISSIFEKYIGDIKGKGILRIVESIYGDKYNSNLLIAEEDTLNSSVKVYNMKGIFTGKSFGENIFKGQVEGITLFEDGNEKGFWIITDQSYNNNAFHVFERKSFEHLGSIKGEKTNNTDGIWLTQRTFGNFSKGAFFAVHNDGNVSAFNLEEILTFIKY
jgi:3-phytase